MQKARAVIVFIVANVLGVACTESPTVMNGGPKGLIGSDAGPIGSDAGRKSVDAGSTEVSILVFSRTLGYRHDSIPDGIAAITTLGRDHEWNVQATEDPSFFDAATLQAFAVVVFLSTTGDVLGPDQQTAFEQFIGRGGGFVGIHSASDTEYDWPFYGGLVGAYFREHPAIQEAVIHVEDSDHPSTAALPLEWRRTDEWYAFQSNPRPNVNVLLTLDETTYDPGTATMGSDHPIAWFHSYEGGRAFYTALGHTRESYSEPSFLAHIAGGIDWAAGR